MTLLPSWLSGATSGNKNKAEANSTTIIENSTTAKTTKSRFNPAPMPQPEIKYEPPSTQLGKFILRVLNLDGNKGASTTDILQFGESILKEEIETFFRPETAVLACASRISAEKYLNNELAVCTNPHRTDRFIHENVWKVVFELFLQFELRLLFVPGGGSVRFGGSGEGKESEDKNKRNSISAKNLEDIAEFVLAVGSDEVVRNKNNTKTTDETICCEAYGESLLSSQDCESADKSSSQKYSLKVGDAVGMLHASSTGNTSSHFELSNSTASGLMLLHIRIPKKMNLNELIPPSVFRVLRGQKPGSNLREFGSAFLSAEEDRLARSCFLEKDFPGILKMRESSNFAKNSDTNKEEPTTREERIEALFDTVLTKALSYDNFKHFIAQRNAPKVPSDASVQEAKRKNFMSEGNSTGASLMKKPSFPDSANPVPRPVFRIRSLDVLNLQTAKVRVSPSVTCCVLGRANSESEDSSNDDVSKIAVGLENVVMEDRSSSSSSDPADSFESVESLVKDGSGSKYVFGYCNTTDHQHISSNATSNPNPGVVQFTRRAVQTIVTRGENQSVAVPQPHGRVVEESLKLKVCDVGVFDELVGKNFVCVNDLVNKSDKEQRDWLQVLLTLFVLFTYEVVEVYCDDVDAGIVESG